MKLIRKHPPKPTQDQIAKAAELRASAADRRQRSSNSFDRCDTDGFLSQWALDIGADKAEVSAKIMENGGFAQHTVLVDGGGNVVSWKLRTFKNDWGYNTVWDVRGKGFPRNWVPFGERSRVQKQLGLREEKRWLPSYAKIHGSGTGLAGCASAHVCTFIDENQLAA